MAKDKHYAVETSGKVIDTLASLLGDDSPLIVWERKVLMMPFEGQPLSKQRSRIKGAHDPRLHKDAHEPEIVADLLVSQGYDHTKIVDITKRERPDVEIEFSDGSKVYAEFTRACDPFDEALETVSISVNQILRERALNEPAMQAALRQYSPHIDLRTRPSVVPDSEALAKELQEFITSQAPGLCTRTAVDIRYPLLHLLGATFWCSDHPYRAGANFVRWDLPTLDLQSLAKSVQQRIDEKRSKGYTLRPLWLLISISESWNNSIGIGAAYRDFFDIVEAGQVTFDTTGFDKVIVGVRARSVIL